MMFVLKTGAYILTNSAAILSDSMESVVHVLATIVALYSVILASRPADKRFPYGYGKVEYFSAGLEGGLIFLAAGAICYAAVEDIITSHRPMALSLGACAVGVAGVINLALGLYLVRTGRQTNSIVLIADGKHVLTDSYTSLGVLVGVLLVKFTHIILLDPLIAIAVALNILWTGGQLIRESVGGLMNSSDPETLERTVEVVNRNRTADMISIHRLRSWRAGERRFIDFHLTLPFYLQLHKSHVVRSAIHDAICSAFDNQAEVMLHLDPCSFSCCTACPKPDCPVRESEQLYTEEFTVAGAQQRAMC